MATPYHAINIMVESATEGNPDIENTKQINVEKAKIQEESPEKPCLSTSTRKRSQVSSPLVQRKNRRRT